MAGTTASRAGEGAKMEILIAIIAWMFILAVLLICPAISYKIAQRKGRHAWGCAILSLFFGPLGIMFTMLLSESTEHQLRKELEIRQALRDLEGERD